MRLFCEKVLVNFNLLRSNNVQSSRQLFPRCEIIKVFQVGARSFCFSRIFAVHPRASTANTNLAWAPVIHQSGLGRGAGRGEGGEGGGEMLAVFQYLAASQASQARPAYQHASATSEYQNIDQKYREIQRSSQISRIQAGNIYLKPQKHSKARPS